MYLGRFPDPGTSKCITPLEIFPPGTSKAPINLLDLYPFVHVIWQPGISRSIVGASVGNAIMYIAKKFPSSIKILPGLHGVLSDLTTAMYIFDHYRQDREISDW